jgi:uncharacterized protein (DUF302 family)
MVQQTTPYGISISTPLSHAEAITRVKEELAKEGFGVLSEIDIAATLKKKLDVDIPQHVILGACNPPLAHQAILAEPEIGLLLPCNVVVREGAEGGCIVSAMDPVEALSLAENEGLAPVAGDVRARLARVLEAVEGG